MQLSQRFTDFLRDLRFDQLPFNVVDACKERIFDSLGVAIGGRREKHVQKLIEFVRQIGGNPDCTVIAHNFKTSPVNAALVNGTMIHSIDFDDTHKFIHPGCGVIPAALAAGEMMKCSGQELIAAVVSGYEASIRVSLAVGLSHRYRGFHPTGTCNSFGAAVAAGKLLRLDSQQMSNAFGIAATLASGLTQYRYDGSMIKHLHGGRSSQNGIVAALLASKGFTGPQEALEGEFGFCRVMADNFDLSAIDSNLGKDFEITRTDIKPYPSCRQTHNPVDIAIKIKQQYSLQPDEIKEINLITYEYITRCPWLIDPQGFKTPLEAMLNIPFCLAVSLKDGYISLSSFSPENLRDQTVRDLAAKTRITAEKAYTEKYPTERNCRLEVITKSGPIYQLHQRNAKGSVHNLLTFTDVAEKFNQLTVSTIGKDRASRIQEAVLKLDQFEDITKSISYLTE